MVTGNNFDGYGFGEISRPYNEARIAILPVPYEGTVSYIKGTARGPSVIIEVSPNAETYDLQTGRDFERLKVATLPPLETAGSPDAVMERIEKRVSEILEDGKHPFILGGEHSITGPAVRAVARHYGEKEGSKIGVVQIDAHADLRDNYSGTVHSHAAVMSRVWEVATAVQFGVRSCSREEAELIKQKNYHIFSPAQTFEKDNLERALDLLPEKIYLTIDIDCLDPSIMPSTGTPEPGGFNWEEINKIIETAGTVRKVIAADLVELSPIKGLHAPDFLAARLAFNILSVFLGAFE